MKYKNLELFFSSPVKYENLTLEVQLNREKVAEINQDMGIDNLEIELFGSDTIHDFVAKMPLDEFISILLEARDALNKNNI